MIILRFKIMKYYVLIYVILYLIDNSIISYKYGKFLIKKQSLLFEHQRSHETVDKFYISEKPRSIIEDRTHTCLDFQIILDALQMNTITMLGAKLCDQYISMNSDVITLNYMKINQLSFHIHQIPLYSSINIEPIITSIEQNTSPPDRETLGYFSYDVDQMVELHKYFINNKDKLDLFENLTEKMKLPNELIDTFHLSFDETLNLNVEKYSTIKQLRSKIEYLRGQIIQTMQLLLQTQDMKDKIADNGFEEIDGRYCFMLKNTYKKGVGIVHGSSNTGRTVYVEPMAVVEPTNQMKAVIALLKEEEHRIFFQMIQCIAKYREELKSSAIAIAEVDVIRAKSKLGEYLGGVIPEVKEDGYIHCVNARHPILMLRASSVITDYQTVSLTKNSIAASTATSTILKPMIRNKGIQENYEQSINPNLIATRTTSANSINSDKVVGNNIYLSENSTALVISGPNAGGKTIVLKTAGLFALMVRHAIPIPAQSGARVDVFHEIMADIGDMQSVSGDLSTFSGHLVICRDILQHAQELKHNKHISPLIKPISPGGCLVLLDEIGTGTDPAQGAALAQAVLEELVSLGSRVIVTTHYQRIKELAAHDPRFRIAAMEFIHNKPTYRLRDGSIGESYALEAARRVHLPENVLIRADALLDDESRRLLALQKRLEEETEVARLKQKDYLDKLNELSTRELNIEVANQQLQEQIQKLREGKTEEYLLDLKNKEHELELTMRKVKDILSAASLQYQQQKQSNSIKNQSNIATAVEEELVDMTNLDGEFVAEYLNTSEEEKEKALEAIKSMVKTERIETEKNIVEQSMSQLQATLLVPGEPIEQGTTLLIIEPGSNLYGTKGIVTHRNKGRGRVFVRVAGVEVKMERHLLARPHIGSLIGKLNIFKGPIDETKATVLTEKEKRFRKMLEEELVDPDKIIKANKKEQNYF